MSMQAAAPNSLEVRQHGLTRRALLTLVGSSFATVTSAAADGFRGIFPIVATPYREDGSVDLDTLAEEVR